jgi:hypothetical protein
MLALKSALLALLTFVALLPPIALFWIIVLGPVMEPVWPALPDGWDTALGVGLFAVAVLSGLALHLVLFARLLRSRLRVAPGSVRWHLATSGLLPPALAIGAAWLVLASMRIGW